MLVLGASGFVGGAVAHAASLAGWQVRGAGRRRPLGCAETAIVDLAEPESLRAACRGATVVVHAAGLAHVTAAGRDAEFESVNVRGTAAVLQAAAAEGVRRVVLVSSVSVYGDAAAPAEDLGEAAPCRPASAYARSKLAGEAVARQAAAAAGLELTIVRLATAYGPGDPGNVARLMRVIDRGRFVWIGAGENRKTLIHVADAGRALASAAAAGAPGGIYNLGAAPVTMAAIVGELALALGRSVPALRIPKGPVLAATRLLPGLGRRGAALAGRVRKWITDDVYDAGRFAHAFDWHPTVSLRAGIQSEVAWYRGDRRGRASAAPAERASPA